MCAVTSVSPVRFRYASSMLRIVRSLPRTASLTGDTEVTAHTDRSQSGAG